MSGRRHFVSSFAIFVFSLIGAKPLAAAAPEPDAIPNWTAPPYWTMPAQPGEEPASREPLVSGRRALTVGPQALPFFAITPCRVADTRAGFGFSGAYGPPSMSEGVARSFPITGQCGIPTGAAAVSFNFTVTNTLGPGFLLVFPEGGSAPGVSTLNYLAAQTIANAAIVPLSNAGGLSAVPGVSGFDLIMDVNGYYAPTGIVSSVNGLQGAVTLAAGSNVTITPSGNTLAIAATGGPGGSLPSGTANQTLYNTGSAWAASSALTNDGTNVALTGTLGLPSSVVITSGGLPFLSTPGTHDTFLGHNAGTLTTGSNDTFFGANAGLSNLTGADDTAFGNGAYGSATGGSADVAVGSNAMRFGSGVGGSNTAVGYFAYNSGPVGTSNTVVGSQALQNASSGDNNVVVGAGGLFHLGTGSSNVAIGNEAGFSLTSGTGNLYLATDAGAASESNTTRIGSSQTAAFIAGVRGVTTGSASGIAVLIDSNGQLGTVSSSARVKDDICDMADESAKLMDLRPVTFRYKAHGPDGPKQFGLIAEEVDAVMPELVARSKDGQVETVMYHEMPAMLLNELQKAMRRIDSLEREVAALKRADPLR